MKHCMKYVMLICALLAGSLNLSAGNCGPTLKSVKVAFGDTAVFRQNNQMNVMFTVDFSDIELGKNQQVIYTPMLISADGEHCVPFGKIVLNSRNMAILEARTPKMQVQDAAQSVMRVNGTRQVVDYAGTQSYQPWMDRASLWLAEDLCGCGDLMSQDRIELASLGRDKPMVKDMLSLFVEPQIELPKVRHESGCASVDFVVNEPIIRPDYRNNRSEINKIVSTIDVVRNDRNVEITGINIHGYASPEDTYEHNAYLAENRTKALTAYVKSLYDIPESIFTTDYTPEDWEGLRSYVAGSNLRHVDEILAIIDDEKMSPDSKEWRIRLRYADDYAQLLESVYPALRRSDYTISYVVRPFSPEEALEVMKSAPKQVSLYEMFWAAQSLDINSEDYKEITNLAVKTYPNEPVANYNAAVMATNNGDYEAALKYLEKVPETARTLNLRGVICLNQGEYTAARRFFSRAVENGMPEAAKNIELIERFAD